MHPVTAGYVFLCHIYIHNTYLHSQTPFTHVSCNQYVAKTDWQLIFDWLQTLTPNNYPKNKDNYYVKTAHELILYKTKCQVISTGLHLLKIYIILM